MLHRYSYLQMLQALTALSFGLVFFLIPTNLFLTLCDSCGYSHGLLSDYLIPKLYLQDITVGLAIFLAVFTAAFEGISKLQGNVQRRISLWISFLSNTHTISATCVIFMSLWLILLVVQLFSSLPVLGTIHWLRLCIFGLFGVIFLAQSRTYTFYKQILLRASQVGLLFQAGVAVFQWHAQQSLAGYWLLGEPTLSAYSGITKITIDGAQFILPYGTTPHPNILGGYASIVVLMSVFSLISTNTKLVTSYLTKKYLHTVITSLSISTILAGLYVIFLTQSAPAALALIIAGALWGIPKRWNIFQFLKNMSYPALVITFGLLWLMSGLSTWQFGADKPLQPSLYRRSYLLESSKKLFSDHSLFGVGLGQFTDLASQELRPFETSRFNQPVHHTIMLWITETGILGIFVLLNLLWILHTYTVKNQQNNSAATSLFSVLLILSPLVVWDHYLISMPQGQLLLLVWTLYFLKQLK